MKTKSCLRILMSMALILGFGLIFSIPTTALPQYIVICAPGHNQGMTYNPVSGTYCIDCVGTEETCFCVFLYLYNNNWTGPGQQGPPGVPVGSLDQEATQEFSSWDYTVDKDGTTHYIFRQ
jgi:hypothetical protein